MSNRWLKALLGAGLALIATSLLSCGYGRRLVSIDIQPSKGFEFSSPDPASQGQFTAIGTYQHPPSTADITNQVAWKTDVPQLVTISKGVISPTGIGCGVADVSASLTSRDNVVIAYSTVTVDDPTNALCPGGSNVLGIVSVTMAGAGANASKVVSAPAGINCPGTCIAQFTVGTTVGLNATPAAGTTVSWAGCTSVNLNTCSVDVLKGTASITATFN